MIQVGKIILNQNRLRDQLCLNRDSALVRHEKDPCKGKTKNLWILNMIT